MSISEVRKLGLQGLIRQWLQRENPSGSHCSNPQERKCSLKQDGSNGGEDEWMKSRNTWKMDSRTRFGGWCHSQRNASLNVCQKVLSYTYRRIIQIQKDPGMFLHFLFIPSALHVNEYARKRYLRLPRVETELM